MTASRDPDRLIRAFLAEGQTDLADQVYDAVRSEIDHTNQRVFIGPWRTPFMNRFVPIALGAAAVVVVLLLGSRFLGQPTNVGSGATPSPEPSVAEPSAAAGGNEEGPLVLTPPGGELRITLTISAPGWYGETPNEGILVKNENSDPPDGAGMIFFGGDLYVYGDPCEWSTTMPDTPATTVDEAVAALTAQASRDASAPVDITLDGYAGKSITLHVPDDAVFSECDERRFASWAGGGDALSVGPSRYQQGPGQIDELWILDVDGVLTVLDAAHYAQTPADHVDEMRAMIESITFE